MEDNKQKTQEGGTPTPPNNEENKGGKTFSQTDMDNLASKVRGEEKAKTEQAIQEAVANALAEERRQAKLTEEEREKEARTKREAELKAREDDITLREMKLKAQELLREKNIPISLVDFVVNLDENKTKENIEKLAKSYAKSVEDGVTDKLKGNPPPDFSDPNKDKDKSKKIVSVF